MTSADLPLSPPRWPRGWLGRVRPTVVGVPARLTALVRAGGRRARVLTAVVPTTGRPVVVELGIDPALGHAVRRRLPTSGRHLAVAGPEDHSPADGPEALVGEVTELTAVLAAHGIGRVDAVVSALAWPTLPAAVVAQVTRVLAPHGAFALAGPVALSRHPLRARRIRRLLHEGFDEVVAVPDGWRRVSYLCRRPRSVPG